MKRFNVIHKLESGDVQSDFDTQAEIDAHKEIHPELYEPLCQTILTDNEDLKVKTEILSTEDQIDLLCKKAYREIKLHNRKYFPLAYVQNVVNHPDFIKLYCLLDGGNPSLSLQMFNIIGFSGYPSTILADVNAYLTEAISLSNLE